LPPLNNGLVAKTAYLLTRTSFQGTRLMSSVTYALSVIVMLAVAAVLVRGLVNMARGGSSNLSNKLMQVRVLLQFLAIVLIVATLWLTGGGR
jgi:hypothetical protein